MDFSFVNELCLDVYDNLGSVGNRPYEPVMLFKILFLSFLYDVSAREMEEQINDRLSFKWFLNLAVNDPSPDHSTLTYFVERIGVDKFEKIFNRIVAQAKTKGLIHERLKIIDSTAIKAKDAKQFYGYKQRILITTQYRSKSFVMVKKNRKVNKLVKLMKSAIYKKTTKERYKVERRFADGKTNHGLGKCRWLRQWKMEI